MRSANAVGADIEALHNRGIRQVALSLDPEIAGRSYWRTLFSELSRRQVRVGLYNEAFQLPSPGFVQAFAQTADLEHSQVALSLLSGTDVNWGLKSLIALLIIVVTLLDDMVAPVTALMLFCFSSPDFTTRRAGWVGLPVNWLRHLVVIILFPKPGVSF